jgi:hypothetical protein
MVASKDKHLEYSKERLWVVWMDRKMAGRKVVKSVTSVVDEMVVRLALKMVE